MTNEIKTTLASRILFFLLCATLVCTTLAYGTVHQPIIAVFYIVAVVVVVLWAYDAFRTGFLRFNKSLVQLPLAAIVVYGFFQVIPFGSINVAAGITDIQRTISLEPFWTKMFALHLLAFLIFLAAFLIYIDTAKRLRKIV